MADKKDNKPKNGFRIQSLIYIILFIGFGYILLKDDGTDLSGEATYTEFKEYMEKGYVDNLVIFSNMDAPLSRRFCVIELILILAWLS